MRKWRKTLAALLIAIIAIGELSQTTFGSYVGMETVNAEEVSTVSSGAISEEQEVEKEVVTAEEETTTVDETAVPQKKTVMKKSTVSVASVSSDTLPSAVDNSTGKNGKYFPEIKSQGELGTCGYWRDYYYVGTYSYNKFYDRITTSENVLSPRWAYARPGGNYTYYNHGATENYDEKRVSYQSGTVTAERTPIEHFSSIGDSQRFDYYVDCEADYMASKQKRIKKTTLFTADAMKGTSFSAGPNSERIIEMKKVLANGDLLGISALISGIGEEEANRVAQIDGKFNKEHVGEYILYANRQYYFINDKGEEECKQGRGHGMAIVGYNDDLCVDINGNGTIEEGERGAFKVANSWGDEYGNEGFIWVSYDAFNTDSKYYKTTEDREEHVSFVYGTYAVEKITVDPEWIGKEEPDYYALVTVSASRRGFELSSVYEEKKYDYVESFSSEKMVSMGYDVAYKQNYGCKDGEGEATFVVACKAFDTKENWYLQLKNTSTASLTVKSIRFVDNVNKKAYRVENANVSLENEVSKTFYWDQSTEAPYIEQFKLSQTNGQVQVKVNASSENGPVKYTVAYTCEGDSDSGTQSGSDAGTYTFEPQKSGYYRVTVTATVTETDTETGEDREISTVRTKLIKVDSTFKITDFDWDLDGNESTANVSRTLSASTLHGNGAVQYKFAAIDRNGEHTIIQDYSTKAKANWKPSTEGTYSLVVYAKDSSGTVVDFVKSVTINPAMKLRSFTIDKPSPQKIGTKIRATVKVTGGTGTKSCKIYADWVRGSSTSSKSQPFSMDSDNSGTFKSNVDATYRIYAVVKDETGWVQTYNYGEYTMEKPDAMVIYDFDWDIDLEETTVGKYRTLTGAVINNRGTVNYKYALKDANGTITDICSYSTNSKVLWTPTKAGEYTLIMYAKDADGTVVQKEKKITVNEKITLESITFDKVSPQTIGTTISATAKVKGGTGNKKCRIHVQGGNYQYGSKDVYFTMNSNTKGTWTPDMDGTYEVLIVMSDDSGYTTMVSGGKYVVNKKMLISDFDWDIDLEETTVGKYRTLTGTVINNSGTVNYKYALKDASGTITDICSYSTNSKVSWQPTKAGEYTLIMYAKDADGTVVQEEKKIKVNERITLESITFDQVSPQKVGTKISATAEVKGGTGNKKCRIHVQGGNYQYGSKDVYFTMSSNTTGSWTPDIDGTYNVFITVTDDSGFTTMLSGGSYVVNKVEEKSTTIYYSGYSTPYIHYMIEGSTWTTVPGVKMEASSEKQGYTHKITIPLGKADKITACFNNGNGSWDSKNGANYSLGVGTYGIKNGVVTNLEGVTITTTPTVTPTVTPTNYISINYDNSKTNWSNVYAYVWAEGNSSVTPVIVKSVACVDNVYTFHVANTYKNILFKNTDGTNSWDKQTGDATLPSTSGYTFITDSGANKTGGHWSTTLVTTPPVTTAPPTNTPIPGNTVTFYYDNSKTNWSNVYVYAWGGETTSAIKGTSLGNNIYAFTISSKYQKVLFKNTAGTSSWDKQTSDVGAPQAGKVFIPSSASNKTGGTWKEYRSTFPTPTVKPTNTPAPGNTVTFYFDNSKTNWSNVYVYAWGGKTTSAIKGTSLGNNVYAFTISSNYQNVLFKNTAGTSSWDKQTADAGAPKAGKVFTPSSASNKTSGTWKESTTFAATNVIYNCLDLTYVNNLAS